jgi:APA family basic amino acid/polyamine antiporter
MSFLNRILAKKPISKILSDSKKSDLVRSLSGWNLTFLGVGGVIGAGIFVMTGQAAAAHAGPAILLSFVLAGIACAFAALCYAELASAIPVSGSAYTYAYATLGEIFAWSMALLLILEYGLSAATVAVGWSGYFVSLMSDFGWHIPPEYTAPLGQIIKLPDGSEIKAIFNIPAFVGLLVVTSLLVLGIKESAKFNNIIVVIKVGIILTFITVGAFFVDSANWHPFIPEATGVEGQYGYGGILKAAGVIFFAYIGFEAVSTAAQEAKDPQKSVPFGIIMSLIICTVLYMLVAGVLTGIVSYENLNVPDPMAVAVDKIGLGWLSFMIKFGAVTGLGSVMLVMLYAQTRIFYMISKDGLLPEFFSKTHKKFKTPHINTLFVGGIVAVAAGLTPLSALGDLVSMGTLIAFAMVCGTVIYLRFKNPDLKRPFVCPGYPYIPLLGIAACLYLVWGIGAAVFVTLKLYFIGGMLFYFGYGYFKSKMR